MACAYDNRDRIISETTTLNEGTPAVVHYAYDAIGQQASTTLGQGPAAITNTLGYNIQGWQTSLQNPYFTSRLRYYDPVQGAPASYTGNISDWQWTHVENGVVGASNTYAFTSDALSRLTDTEQFVDGVRGDRDVEKGLRFDKNGNIRTLKRYSASTLTDDFNYMYTGNRLRELQSSEGSYSYSSDYFGNTAHDGLNNLDTRYNVVNLAVEICEGNVLKSKYCYLYDGTKVGATGIDNTGLSYAGSLVYNTVVY